MSFYEAARVPGHLAIHTGKGGAAGPPSFRRVKKFTYTVRTPVSCRSAVGELRGKEDNVAAKVRHRGWPGTEITESQCYPIITHVPGGEEPMRDKPHRGSDSSPSSASVSLSHHS
ncbi:unnamed protein product [Cuscuta europaea]|uniref:Uncharacterized protein n=1 Tax=Cuscuta europaea TaxID=41803 RepID=A0A9P1E1Z6_CUSEU|nr:unnamed protein product [Cuscuta europaea]